MLFATKHRLEEHIIELLDKGDLEGPLLVEALREIKPNVTKQAVYAILRRLLVDEVLVKSGKNFALNRYWMHRVYEFASRHINVGSDLLTSHVLDMEEGDRMSYQFKNPFLLDIYWGHLYDLIYEAADPRVPLLNFHPHEWLSHVRESTEKLFLGRFVKDKKLMFFSIGGNTDLDKQFKKDFTHPQVQINTGVSYGLNNNNYLSVVGDFIFEVSTTVGFGQDIDDFYTTHKHMTPQALEELTQLTQKQGKSKLVLMKNKKKAAAWYKKFEKDFVVPKGYEIFEG